MKYLLITLIFFSSSSMTLTAEDKPLSVAPLQTQDEPGTVMFTPPPGWRFADSANFPKSVHVTVVGKGQREYPPSMHLGTEKYTGTLKDYLKIVKSLNDADGTEWKDLGAIRTEAGEASLSQADSKTEWGDVRMMHVILVKNGTVYILTAAALKEEFPRFYKEFFQAMRSLRINKDIYEMLPDDKKREQLKDTIANLAKESDQIFKQKKSENASLVTKEDLFKDPEFQKNQWEAFSLTLDKSYPEMSTKWKEAVLSTARNEIIKNNKNS